VTATAVAEERLRAPTAAAPYKGLTPYDEDDAPFFFGRESERRIIVANLVGARLTLLYGESGVGKTSVLRAGVIPDLRRDAARNAEERGAPGHVAVAFSEWRDDPVRGVVEAIGSAAPELGHASSLDELLEEWTETAKAVLLLVLDQFEEYLLYHPDRGADDDFAAQLTRAITRRDLRVHILIAIREDALAKLDRFKGRIPHVFENYLRLEHLDLAAAHAAILKPLDRYNEDLPPSEHVSIEPRLVRDVLDHVRAEHVDHAALGRGRSPDDDVSGRVETPYLQLVMRRLWTEEEAAGSRVLRCETLARLGGPSKIVHAHLGEAMASLSPEDRDVAAVAFHYLVTPSGTKIAYSAADLAGQADLDEEHVGRVLERLSRHDARILRPVPPPPDDPGNARYEIFHDVLADAILDWRATHAQDKVRFAARVRERNFFRVATVVLGLIVVALGALAVVAVRQRDDAREQQQFALSRKGAVESLTAGTPALRIAIAENALRAAPTADAEEALTKAFAALDDSLTISTAFGALESAAFTAGGNWVLTASEDGFPRLVQPGGKLQSEGHGASGLTGAASTPDGRHVITWRRDAPLALWRVAPPVARWRGDARNTPIWQRERVLRAAGPVAAAAFDARGARVATTGADGVIRIWQRGRAAPVRRFDKRIAGAQTIAFAPAGELLVTAARDGTVDIWSTGSGTISSTIPRGAARATAASFDGDGTRVVAAGDDGRARIWRVGDRGQASVILGRRGERLNDARFSPDGRYVVTAGDDAKVRVFDVSKGAQVAVLRKHLEPVRTATFRSDGNVVLTASDDVTARLWHWNNRR